MEAYKNVEIKGDAGNAEIREFINELSGINDENLSVGCIYGTYEVDADSYTLTFNIEGNRFEIRSIDVRGNLGLGSKIINSIHTYSDENELDVIASNVRDTAKGFWENMGYQESESAGEYFRKV